MRSSSQVVVVFLCLLIQHHLVSGENFDDSGGGGVARARSVVLADPSSSEDMMAAAGAAGQRRYPQRGRGGGNADYGGLNNKEHSNGGGGEGGWKWWRYHELSEREILDHLVHRQRYDRREIPPSNGPLRINVSVTVVEMEDEDDYDSGVESSRRRRFFATEKKKEASLFLTQTWFDPRLIHSDSGGHLGPYLNGIHHREELWLPTEADDDITRVSGYSLIADSNVALYIFGNGSVVYVQRIRTAMKCKAWKFDGGKTSVKKGWKCSLTFESVAHSSDEVEWKWSLPRGVFLSPSLVKKKAAAQKEHEDEEEDEEEKIVSGECKSDFVLGGKGNHSCLFFEVIFPSSAAAAASASGRTFNRRREANFAEDFFLGAVIPDAALVLCALSSLWIDPGSATTARSIMLSVSLVALFASADFAGYKNGGDPYDCTRGWHLMSLGFILALCAEFALVHFLGGKKRSGTFSRISQRSSSGGRIDANFGFQNELRRGTTGSFSQQQLNHPHLEQPAAAATATLRSAHHHHHHTLQHHHHHNNPHHFNLQQNLGNLSTSTPAVDGCSKCLVLSSPFRATTTTTTGGGSNAQDFESMDDARSISSGLFGEKIAFRDFKTISSSSSASSTSQRLDRFSRVLFPTLYIFLLVTFFCQYFA